MGYIKHHAIAITSFHEELLKKAHNKAKQIFDDTVTEIIKSKMNRYYSFFISPDGSKEGWDDSELGNKRRKTFLNWCQKQAYEDGSNALSYAELFYGEDNGYAEIETHN